MSEQLSPEEPDDVPEYRLSHLKGDVASAFTERGHVQKVAPFGQGGLKPRVQNRVTFAVSAGSDADDLKREVDRVLETEGFAWTYGEGPGKYVVLGREIADLRELRKDDRIHLNKRGGPFKVYRVLEQPTGPEELQRSAPSVTVELTNTDTETDWMVVHWKNDSEPWAYVRTKDRNAKGGYRYKKVEKVERAGRIGPERWFAPSSVAKADIEQRVPELIQKAKDASERIVHPSDLADLETLFAKPIPDVFKPEPAMTTREFLENMSEWYEREANALEVETEQDKEHAAAQQDAARQCESLADVFNLLNMEAVDNTEDTELWVCEDCGQAFENKHKYPTHRRDCPEKADGDEQADEQHTEHPEN